MPMLPASFAIRPALTILPSQHYKLTTFNSLIKPKPTLQFRRSGKSCSSGFVCNRNRVLGLKSMTELIRVSAFGNNTDEEERALFKDVSSEFQDDVLAGGIESTLNSLSKWLVAALFGGVILLRHDAEAMWAAMGSVLNAILSVALKRLLNQERPVANLRPDPGMPSSHAQSIFYTVMFSVLSLQEWLGTSALSVAISGLSFALGSYLSWLRVSQRLHTVTQIVVGGAVGSSFCLLWYITWKATVLEAFTSSLWVQIVVVIAAAGFCLGFLIYVIRYWFKKELLR